MDVDGILSRIGELGRAQWKILVLLQLTSTFVALTQMTLPFVGRNPGWNCTSSDATLPPSHSSKCLLYERGECTPKFSKDYTSIVTEWNLICSKSHLPNYSQSGVFVGMLLGSWIFGAIADKIGRKKVVFSALLCTALATLCSAIVPSFKLFVPLRVTIGFFNQGIVIAVYTLIVETVGISKRSLASAVGFMFFPIGFPLLALLAYSTGSWRVFTGLSSLAGFVLLPLWRWIPESPRWLLVNGREEEAKRVLRQIALGNGCDMPLCELKKPSAREREEPVSVLDLFRSKTIAKRTVICFIAWFINYLLYYALSMNSGRLGGSIYVSFTLSGLIEIPALIGTYFLLNSIGRKWTHCGLIFLGGVACIMWTILYWQSHSGAVKLGVALTGKFAIAGSFSAIFLYSAELFPTQLRNLGLGVTSVGARMGGISAPLILLLASRSEGLPMAVMGFLAVATGVLGLALPETLDQPMPETLEDLEGHAMTPAGSWNRPVQISKQVL